MLPRTADRTNVFVEDWTRLAHSGRDDLRRRKDVMLRLVANDAPLGPQWLDHALVGEWADHRACHVGGDGLLSYRLDGSSSHEQGVFVRAGSHAELFE